MPRFTFGKYLRENEVLGEGSYEQMMKMEITHGDQITQGQDTSQQDQDRGGADPTPRDTAYYDDPTGSLNDLRSLRESELRCSLQHEMAAIDNVCTDSMMNYFAAVPESQVSGVFGSGQDSVDQSVQKRLTYEDPQDNESVQQSIDGSRVESERPTEKVIYASPIRRTILKSPRRSQRDKASVRVGEYAQSQDSDSCYLEQTESDSPQSPATPAALYQSPAQSIGKKYQVFPTSKIKSVILIDDKNYIKTNVTKEEWVTFVRKGGDATSALSPEVREKLESFKTTPIETVLHYANTGKFLKEMQEDNGMADVSVTIGGDVFNCHRVALACYSEYFKDLFFKSEKYRKVPIVVRLRGIHPESFGVFLKYVYTGQLEIKPELAGDLIILAEKLCIPVLKGECMNFMDKMPVEQALLLIKHGIVASSVVLFDCVMSCISEKFTELPNFIEFLKLDAATVTMIMSHDHLIVKSEVDVFKVGIKWIAYDQVEREQYISRIMACVRFNFMQQGDIFECLELSDALTGNAYCRDALLKANWLITARYLGKKDPLNLQSPKPRTTYAEAEMRKNSEMFHSAHSLQIEEVDAPPTPSPQVDYNRSSGSTDEITHGYILAMGGFQCNDRSFGVKEAKFVKKYSTGANEWQDFCDLPQPRLYHAVVMLDRKVFLLGGTDPRTSFKAVPSPTNHTFSFDLDYSTWGKVAFMNTSRMFHAACCVSGLIYVIGGQDNRIREISKFRVLDNVECYNPTSDTWFTVQPMREARLGCSVAVMDGFIYVVGGYSDTVGRASGNNVLSSVERYDPRSNEWTELMNLRIPRCHGNLVTVNGNLYLCGGATRSYTVSDTILTSECSVDKFDRESGTWCHVTDMVIGRHSAGAAVIGSKIYIAGGISSSANRVLQSMEVYDVKEGTWMKGIEELPYPAKWLSCVTVPYGT
ncbi:hypothetical protein FSP39_005736 [Pinctada imbricata]|uniref:BTB domain-containing protein n=1 Tax=Pinctada imbricata TaxID=66713 RepID=A0AA88YHC2_PINIB|nr:hypothetical protein FSP39_005736 [Pinctada imbricata]